MKEDVIRIGGASGFWGDATLATEQLLREDKLDYLVYDYLAEVTMSIMARARAINPDAGFAPDFVSSAIGPSLRTIAERKIKVISNAGGVNPEACAEAIRAAIEKLGLNLKVFVVTGDDLINMKEVFESEGKLEMFSGRQFPPSASVVSINAYLGAFPIAQALSSGADIVITGRCVDSAVTLAACIHRFGWRGTDYDLLAQGTLAGHLIECGTQVCGGNFTDWEEIADSLPTVGYPIAEVTAAGDVYITKAKNTGGVINIGTVSEQLVYEIADPRSYIVPDVVCDFSEVNVAQCGVDSVFVSGAKGHGAPNEYKVSVTYADGFRTGLIFTLYGHSAEKKARATANNMLTRARNTLSSLGFSDFDKVCIEIIGSESHFGKYRKQDASREVDFKISVQHKSKTAVDIFLREVAGMSLSSPPGLTAFAGGGRSKASPVVRLFSCLVKKDSLSISIKSDCEQISFNEIVHEVKAQPVSHALPELHSRPDEDMVEVDLIDIAWGRSGDKGNNVNIGIIARDQKYFPYIAKVLSKSFVQSTFQHFFEDENAVIDMYCLPGTHAINFLLHSVLGGGGMASLRNDPQGKGYAQVLLCQKVSIPSGLLN